MTGYICEAVNNDCYALAWSFGEVCVGCGCCSKDELTRVKARLEYHREQLKEELSFDRWACDPEMVELQRKNRDINIEFEKRKIKEYEDLLKELEESDAKAEITARLEKERTIADVV